MCDRVFFFLFQFAMIMILKTRSCFIGFEEMTTLMKICRTQQPSLKDKESTAGERKRKGGREGVCVWEVIIVQAF